MDNYENNFVEMLFLQVVLVVSNPAYRQKLVEEDSAQQICRGIRQFKIEIEGLLSQITVAGVSPFLSKVRQLQAICEEEA